MSEQSQPVTHTGGLPWVQPHEYLRLNAAKDADWEQFGSRREEVK